MKSSQIVEEAMDEYTDLLFRIAYYVQDPYVAEDIVQDVFIKIYYSSYEEKGEFKGRYDNPYITYILVVYFLFC